MNPWDSAPRRCVPGKEEFQGTDLILFIRGSRIERKQEERMRNKKGRNRAKLGTRIGMSTHLGTSNGHWWIGKWIVDVGAWSIGASSTGTRTTVLLPLRSVTRLTGKYSYLSIAQVAAAAEADSGCAILDGIDDHCSSVYGGCDCDGGPASSWKRVVFPAIAKKKKECQ